MSYVGDPKAYRLEVIADFQDIVGNVYTKNSGDAGAPLKKVKLMFDADIVIKSILAKKLMLIMEKEYYYPFVRQKKKGKAISCI